MKQYTKNKMYICMSFCDVHKTDFFCNIIYKQISITK